MIYYLVKCKKYKNISKYRLVPSTDFNFKKERAEEIFELVLLQMRMH